MSEAAAKGGWSVGAWVMLAGVLLATPFAAAVVVIAVVFGVNPLAPGSQPGSMPLAAISLIALLFAGLGGLVFLIGDALYVIVPCFSRDAARRGYASYATILASLVLAVVLSTIVQVIFMVGELVASRSFQVTRGAELTPTALAVDVISLEVALVFVLWIRVIRPGMITWQDMGFNANGLGLKVLIGIGTGVAMFVVSSALEYVLRQFGIEQTQMQQFEAVKRATPAQFALILFAGAVTAPFAEESFFRGYIVTGRLRLGRVVPAFVFSALLFSASHFNVQAFVPIFVIGLMLAFVFYRTNSIVPTMVAHAMNNAIAFSALYFNFG